LTAIRHDENVLLVRERRLDVDGFAVQKTGRRVVRQVRLGVQKVASSGIQILGQIGERLEINFDAHLLMGQGA
jgi:hypothetical protein